MLTRAEKDAISRYLAMDQRPSRFWWDFSPYLVPPLLFAAYGLWKAEFLAMTVAFGVLLFLALWYLSYHANTSKHIHSAVHKYEDAVRALEKPDAPSD